MRVYAAPDDRVDDDRTKRMSTILSGARAEQYAGTMTNMWAANDFKQRFPGRHSTIISSASYLN
jgi:hypothetical protein